MKIQARNSNVHSMSLVVPVDGIISIDEQGIADVSPKCAAALVKGTNDWDFVKGTAKDEGEEVKAETEEEVTEQKGLLEDELKDMKFADMKTMAEEAGLPEEEWGKLNSKKLLTAYLIKKFKEASE